MPESLGLTTEGWEIYDMKKEFERQGINEADGVFRIQQCWYPEGGKNI